MARTILLIGASGRGKSTSLRNLDKQTTLLINCERKALPFKNSKDFPQIRPKTIKETFDILDKYYNNKTIKVLVIDSFSAFADMLVAEARILKSGWDVWAYYDTMLYSFFEKIRKFNDNNIHIVITGHDETIEDEEGSGIKRLKTKGKSWQGTLEKEFDIVLWCISRIKGENIIEYKFQTQSNGKTPSKSPIDMLDYEMDNDLKLIIDKINEYDK